MIDQIREAVKGSEYDFLRNSPHLGSKIMLLGLGGSIAYGTNLATSDVDIRGCALGSKSDLLGLSHFEQVTDLATDTTIYSFGKLIGLLINCNPNTIEILGCKPEHYLTVTPIGRELLDNSKMFLSKRAVSSFGGYAGQQLRRLESALARDTYPQEERERHIMKSCQSAMRDFHNRYTDFPEGSIKLSVGSSDRADMEAEIFADVSLAHYPLRDYKNIWHDLNFIVREYSKLGKRNHKKDGAHLNKHAMHLIRLYLMCFDILEKEEIVTYREKDCPLLMSIRSGEFQSSDGTFRSEFFEMLSRCEERLSYAEKNTSLPDNPDMKLIEDFVISVNERAVNGDY